MAKDRQMGGPEALELRRLAEAWRASFCGACAAGPDYPRGRCPDCLRKLARILEPPEAEGDTITPVDRPKP